MAALMIKVPDETARVLRELPVPGKREEVGTAHITVMYLGKDIPIEMISSMLPVIYGVTSTTLPFSVETEEITTFPPGDDGVPVIAKIQSPALHGFRAALCAAFDEAGMPYDKKFPEYKPHTTLAYDEDEDTHGFELDIPPISWGAHELVLWGSNRGEGRLVVKFPLSLPLGKTASPRRESALHRAAVQVAAWAQRDRFA